MQRRRVLEEPTVNHERWLVSYADFITLLFAFFVVMYSISQVNEGKYKVLSNTLTEAFSTNPFKNTPRTLDPFQVGDIVKSNPKNYVELEPTAIVENETGDKEQPTEALEGNGPDSQNGGIPTELQQINNRLGENFSELIDEELISLRGNEEWLEVELKSSLLFSSGDARLSNSALELLGGIAEVLKGAASPVRVEGFTDDIPINTAQFPSNWELSTARASAVVQLFIEEGVEPERLAAIGYGEFQPVADNDTEEGRSANRRVVLMISKTGELRPDLRVATSPDELRQQAQERQRGIEITIPGVNEVDNDAPEEGQPASEELQSEVPKDPMQGIRTIELEDGGLLFTNESPAEDDR